MRIGRFASEGIRTGDELPVGHPAVGLRWDRVEVRLTKSDLYDPQVIRWLQYISNRCEYAYTFTTNITVVPTEYPGKIKPIGAR